MRYFGVEFPDKFSKPRFVETVEGCFTLQVEYTKHEEVWKESDQKLLVDLSRKILENITGKAISSYDGQ